VSSLRECGYAGWLSGEFMPLPDADTAAQRAIQHMQALVRG
jgi:sugar phosphate isomerase/epimerase